MKIKLLLLLLFPTIAFAQGGPFVKFPSDPILIVGPQGRPIPDGLATVTNTDGVVVTVYTDRTGNTPLASPFVVPQTGIVQFFADADIYIVGVTGNGVSRSFYVTAGGGVSSNTRFISIDRTASNLELNTTNPGILFCDVDELCVVQMDDDVDRSFRSNWTMPSFPLTLSTLNIYFKSDTGNNGNAARFDIKWCTIEVGETTCTPANTKSFTQAVQSDGKRTVLSITHASLAEDWNEDDHVIVEIFRDADHSDDTVTGMIHIFDVRYEWERD